MGKPWHTGSRCHSSTYDKTMAMRWLRQTQTQTQTLHLGLLVGVGGYVKRQTLSSQRARRRRLTVDKAEHR